MTEHRQQRKTARGAWRIMPGMSDQSSAPRRAAAVRPRDAASLIVLRGEGRELELLAGRRALHLRFMPGVYVFPGGAIDRRDHSPWSVETGSEALPEKLLRAARAALRETWEETGVLVGRQATSPALGTATAPIEGAYGAAGLAAAFDRLTYVGRAITPSHSQRRFNTRFFLADGSDVYGELAENDEFEDVDWHPIGRRELDPLRDVTRFMLDRAIAIRAGRAAHHPPLFYWAKNARRLGICREGFQEA
jgi:8-oxo-dGTP pyrophosphatase MutT (NUDIX family)